MSRLLALILCVLAAPAQAQLWTLTPPDSAASFFGAAVALDGNRALVGAPGEDACGPDSGAAYVYEREDDSAGRFEVVARLAPAACAEGRLAARAVALEGGVALIASGGTVIDARRPNAAHLFERDAEGAWREAAVFEGEALGPFATDLALSGRRGLVTALGQPAWIVEPDADGTWRRVARVAPEGPMPERFGLTGTLSGDRAVVSAAPRDEAGTGSLFVFERDEAGSWRETARLTGIASDRMAIALEGSMLLVGHERGGPNRVGKAVLYGHRPDGAWQRLATLAADVPQRDGAFGREVALYRGASGLRAAIVGYVEQLGRSDNVDRVVQVFRYDAQEGWQRGATLDLGTWAFGASVALGGRTVLVGSTAEGERGRVIAARLVEALPE